MNNKKKMLKKDFNLANISSVEDIRALSLSFEEAYEILEKIIKKQEDNTSNLQETVLDYKLGKMIIEYCNDILKQVKQDIEYL